MRRPRKVPRYSFASGAIVAALALGLAPGAGGQSAAPKKGSYSGSTKQDRVIKSARKIAFKVRGKKISLTTEPAVARNFCISAPVFLEDVSEVTVKLGKAGKFSFESTFIGTKINRISGAFNENGEIEGEILYHFNASDAGLCSAGKAKTTFTAKRRKK